MGVWLEERDHDALSQWSSETWSNVRDAKPGNLPQPTFGVRIVRDHKTKEAQFREGMQGRILSRKGEWAFVQVYGLYDADRKPLKAWAHVDACEIGRKVYGSWQVDVSFIPRTPAATTLRRQS
jgi:hypothetical protein